MRERAIANADAEHYRVEKESAANKVGILLSIYLKLLSHFQ